MDNHRKERHEEFERVLERYYEVKKQSAEKKGPRIEKV